MDGWQMLSWHVSPYHFACHNHYGICLMGAVKILPRYQLIFTFLRVRRAKLVARCCSASISLFCTTGGLALFFFGGFGNPIAPGESNCASKMLEKVEVPKKFTELLGACLS